LLRGRTIQDVDKANLQRPLPKITVHATAPLRDYQPAAATCWPRFLRAVYSKLVWHTRYESNAPQSVLETNSPALEHARINLHTFRDVVCEHACRKLVLRLRSDLIPPWLKCGSGATPTTDFHGTVWPGVS